MKLCKNCAHYRLHAKGHACGLHVRSETDVVTGYPFQTGQADCYAERDAKGRCGPEGKLYLEVSSCAPSP